MMISPRSGRRKPTETAAAIALACTAALALLGLFMARRTVSAQRANIKSLESQLKHSQEMIAHEKSLYSHLDYEYRAAQNGLHDVTRRLHAKEAELLEKANQLRYEKDEWMRANTQLQMTVSELHEQLSYERAIVEAHKKKLEELEAAHSSREKDWHDLAAKWRKYEADANAENARLLAELAHFQKSTSIPKPATPLPEEEPQLRPETQFKAQVELPKAEEYIHPHPKDPPPASTHGPASHLTPGQHGALGGHGQGEHMQQQQQQQPPPQPHLLPHGMAASHVDGHSLHGGLHRDLAAEGAHRPAAPNPLEYHHGDAYPPAGDWEGGGHHYNEHLDPLDHCLRRVSTSNQQLPCPVGQMVWELFGHLLAKPVASPVAKCTGSQTASTLTTTHSTARTGIQARHLMYLRPGMSVSMSPTPATGTPQPTMSRTPRNTGSNTPMHGGISTMSSGMGAQHGQQQGVQHGQPHGGQHWQQQGDHQAGLQNQHHEGAQQPAMFSHGQEVDPKVLPYVSHATPQAHPQQATRQAPVHMPPVASAMPGSRQGRLPLPPFQMRGKQGGSQRTAQHA
ncbi:hypothetical protein QJQ45_029643 [Haematococcus lacustris]|nr:hypothetical protein QJQ45_029643 [Haematococcus lacustris]